LPTSVVAGHFRPQGAGDRTVVLVFFLAEGAEDTRSDRLFRASSPLARQIGVCEERAGHAHEVGLAFTKNRFGLLEAEDLA